MNLNFITPLSPLDLIFIFVVIIPLQTSFLLPLSTTSYFYWKKIEIIKLCVTVWRLVWVFLIKNAQAADTTFKFLFKTSTTPVTPSTALPLCFLSVWYDFCWKLNFLFKYTRTHQAARNLAARSLVSFLYFFKRTSLSLRAL